jgi:hypothetical protein
MVKISVFCNDQEIMNDIIAHEFYIFEDSANHLFWYEKSQTPISQGFISFGFNLLTLPQESFLFSQTGK